MKAVEGAHNQDIRMLQPVQAVLAELVQNLTRGDTSWFVLTDRNTFRFCWPLVSQVLPETTHVIMFGAGEKHKDMESCMHVWHQLMEDKANRHSILINLGGGVVCDLGGFAASVFMRGLRFINIPTTLLSMVDAAVGGKTGIDLDGLKNMIGLFTYPQTVIIDPVFLESLPEKEFRSGMVEVCKHALIADASYWNKLQQTISESETGDWKDLFKNQIPDIIRRAVEIKSAIVNKDPFEKGDRKFLNFGHTIGHALESYSLKHDDHPLSHGEAVSVGLVCEAFLSMKICGLSPEIMAGIHQTMKIIFPKIVIKKDSFSELIHLMSADKKSEAGTSVFALLRSAGTPVLQMNVPAELIHESFLFYNG